jgi:hypothetical protein
MASALFADTAMPLNRGRILPTRVRPSNRRVGRQCWAHHAKQQLATTTTKRNDTVDRLLFRRVPPLPTNGPANASLLPHRRGWPCAASAFPNDQIGQMLHSINTAWYNDRVDAEMLHMTTLAASRRIHTVRQHALAACLPQTNVCSCDMCAASGPSCRVLREARRRTNIGRVRRCSLARMCSLCTGRTTHSSWLPIWPNLQERHPREAVTEFRGSRFWKCGQICFNTRWDLAINMSTSLQNNSLFARWHSSRQIVVTRTSVAQAKFVPVHPPACT